MTGKKYDTLEKVPELYFPSEVKIKIALKQAYKIQEWDGGAVLSNLYYKAKQIRKYRHN